MTHDEIKEMIALHALDLLGEAESHALESHLASSADDEREFAQLRDTVAMLAYTVAPIAPPSHSREALLEKIRKTKPNTNSSGGASELSREPETPSNVVPLSRAKPRPTPAFDGSRLVFSAWRYGAIAAALLLGVCLVALGTAWQRLGETRAEVARLRAIESTLASERERADKAEAIAAMMRSPDARIALLAGTPQAPRAHGRFVFDAQTGEALLVSFDLPPAPAGKAYQAWFIADGVPLPGGVFTADAAGRVVFREQVPTSGRRAALFAITLEDAGGVQKPQGQQFLAGKLS
jgi:anti-sigma-K factor RskA